MNQLPLKTISDFQELNRNTPVAATPTSTPVTPLISPFGEATNFMRNIVPPSQVRESETRTTVQLVFESLINISGGGQLRQHGRAAAHVAATAEQCRYQSQSRSGGRRLF